MLGWTVQGYMSPFSQPKNSLVPCLNYFPSTYSDLDRVAPAITLVKNLTILKFTHVMHPHQIIFLYLLTLAFFSHYGAKLITWLHSFFSVFWCSIALVFKISCVKFFSKHICLGFIYVYQTDVIEYFLLTNTTEFDNFVEDYSCSYYSRKFLQTSAKSLHCDRPNFHKIS